MIDNFVKELVEEILGDHLEIGMISIHPTTQKKVKIIDGQYWGTYGLSNFWYWKEVLGDNALSEETFHGYGWNPRKNYK
jgi:hypothetical protein